MPTNKLLLATSIPHVLVAIGHTIKGSQFADPAFRRLRPILQGQAKAGWYQGSLLFTLIGLINYRWAITGYSGSGVDTAIISVVSTIYFGSAAWYVKTGDTATAAVLGPVGVLQIFAALRA